MHKSQGGCRNLIVAFPSSMNFAKICCIFPPSNYNTLIKIKHLSTTKYTISYLFPLIKLIQEKNY